MGHKEWLPFEFILCNFLLMQYSQQTKYVYQEDPLHIFCCKTEHIYLINQLCKNSFRIFMDLLILSWMPILMILEIHKMVGNKDGIIRMKIQPLIGYCLKDGMMDLGNLDGSCGSLELFPYFLDFYFISKQSILQKS